MASHVGGKNSAKVKTQIHIFTTWPTHVKVKMVLVIKHLSYSATSKKIVNFCYVYLCKLCIVVGIV
ncbi:hypothetical protein ACB092_10G058600 [Castanea dentata]